MQLGWVALFLIFIWW